VAVEKLFSGYFGEKFALQVIEYSLIEDAEIHQNYCVGSFFNSHRR